MSKTKLTPLQVVERQHKKYLAFEDAFNRNPYNQEDLNKELMKLVEKDLDMNSEEFIDSMADIVMEKPQKRFEVNNAALKFMLFADFYLMTQEEDLPLNIKKDYDNLPIKNEIKSFYSIDEKGDFVKNEDAEISEETKEYFKSLYAQIKLQKE